MTNVPKKVADRLTKQINVFQRVLEDAKRRDINESNTVTIITDMLSDVFGFDRYQEITREVAIKSTYCDLAVQVDGATQYLIEVKAIGLTLKNNHLKQATNYGANEGIPWVVLTNGIHWQVYRINFKRPVSHELVLDFDFLTLSSRKTSDVSLLYLLCRSGMNKDAIAAYHKRAQTVNRFVLAALIRSDAIIPALRRELKRLAVVGKVTDEDIEALLPGVLKRDVLEGEPADAAARLVKREMLKKAREKEKVVRKPTETTGSSTADFDSA